MTFFPVCQILQIYHGGIPPWIYLRAYHTFVIYSYHQKYCYNLGQEVPVIYSVVLVFIISPQKKPSQKYTFQTNMFIPNNGIIIIDMHV